MIVDGDRRATADGEVTAADNGFGYPVGRVVGYATCNYSASVNGTVPTQRRRMMSEPRAFTGSS